jgi:hypothetical protein
MHRDYVMLLLRCVWKGHKWLGVYCKYCGKEYKP